MNTYGHRDTTLVKGEGPYVWDDRGRRYLDAISGIAVCGLGYSHPKIVDALCDQARTLIHCSNLYLNRPQQDLGDLLLRVSGMDKVFFGNSGAEANEAAIKIARKFGRDKGIALPQIITADNSFHGRTMATLSATGNAKIQKGFDPLVPGFVRVPYASVDAVAQAGNNDTVAVFVEPVQGEGGIRVPPTRYLNELRELCNERGWLLMCDEIQSGNGRAGAYFAYQLNGILPDVVTTAKGLGNGLPIGACLARGDAAGVLQQGNHGSTFGGNPLVTRTALAVVETIVEENYLERVQHLSQLMLSGLKAQLDGVKGVVEVRGLGLLIGIELERECAELVEKAKQKNILINVTNARTVRLLPPFILSDEQAQEIVDTVCRVIKEFL